MKKRRYAVWVKGRRGDSQESVVCVGKNRAIAHYAEHHGVDVALCRAEWVKDYHGLLG